MLDLTTLRFLNTITVAYTFPKLKVLSIPKTVDTEQQNLLISNICCATYKIVEVGQFLPWFTL